MADMMRTARVGGRLLIVAGGLLATLVLMACGDSSGDEPQTPQADSVPGGELLTRVSAVVAKDGGPDEVTYANLSDARAQLGDSPREPLSGPTAKGSELFSSVAIAAVPYATYRGGLSPSPLNEAIDGGRVRTAASRTGLLGDTAVAVLQTSQPFAEISERLSTRGYRKEGDLLVTDQSFNEVYYPVVADAGNGVVVLAGSEDAARTALDGGDGDLTEAAQLIGQVPGVLRMAGPVPDATCARYWALGQQAAPQSGKFMVVVDGDADPEQVTIAGKKQGGIEFAQAEASGDVAAVPFRSAAKIDLVSQAIDPASSYRC